MSSRNDEEEEKPRRINWAIWLPTIIATIGVAICFFPFCNTRFGRVEF